MQRSCLLVQVVERAVERLTGELLERRDRGRLVVADDVQLGAVARRETDGVAELARKRGGAWQVERHPLAQLDGCDVMRQADERERHVKWLPASASRATITSTKPPSARYAARRPDGRETRNAE